VEGIGNNTGCDEIIKDRRLRQGVSSNTWTSSSGAASDEDGNDDRTPFIEEYNKLAKKVKYSSLCFVWQWLTYGLHYSMEFSRLYLMNLLQLM
jgi:hypothetical protein